MITTKTIASAPPGKVIKDVAVTGLELYIGKTKKTWRVYYRTRSERKERRLGLGSYPTLSVKQAREIAREVLVDVARGQDPAQRAEKSKTLEQIYYEFIDAMASQLKQKTLEGYEASYHAHLKPLGRKPLTDIRKQDVAAMHRGASLYAGNRALALLSRLYTFAISLDIVPAGSNPCVGVTRNKEQPRTRYATADELRSIGGGIARWRLSTHYKQRQFADLLSLLILTGARLNEIANSKCEYYNLEQGSLCLPDSKTGRKTICLSAEAVRIAQRHHNNSRAFLFQHDTLIAPIKGAPKMWKKFKEEFDLGDLRIHDLRRSYATYAKSAGIGLAHISDLLGHSNSRTTERHYAFLKDDVRAEQSETISRLMQQSLDRQ